MNFPRMKKDLKAYMTAVEQFHIEKALKKNGNSRAAAARELGLNRTTLLEKMKSLGIVEAFPPNKTKSKE